MVLGLPWVGQLEACGHFGKGMRSDGLLRQPGFLKHPSCCWQGCDASVEVEEYRLISQGTEKLPLLLKARFFSKTPVGRRQNHKLAILSWISRHPTFPRVSGCLAEGQSVQC